MKNIISKLKTLTTVILLLAVFSANVAGCGTNAQTSDVAADTESVEQTETQDSASASESSTEDEVKETAAEDAKAASKPEAAEEDSNAVSEAASAQESSVSEKTATDAAAEVKEEVKEEIKEEIKEEAKEEVKEETASSGSAESDESYILLSDGTKLYDGQSINASQIGGAKFILQGVPQSEYWATAFLSWGPYYANEDPEPNWAYDQTVNAGSEISLAWPAQTVNEFADCDYLYVSISTKDYSFDKEWNFKVVR